MTRRSRSCREDPEKFLLSQRGMHAGILPHSVYLLFIPPESKERNHGHQPYGEDNPESMGMGLNRY